MVSPKLRKQFRRGARSGRYLAAHSRTMRDLRPVARIGTMKRFDDVRPPAETKQCVTQVARTSTVPLRTTPPNSISSAPGYPPHVLATKNGSAEIEDQETGTDTGLISNNGQ